MRSDLRLCLITMGCLAATASVMACSQGGRGERDSSPHFDGGQSAERDSGQSTERDSGPDADRDGGSATAIDSGQGADAGGTTDVDIYLPPATAGTPTLALGSSVNQTAAPFCVGYAFVKGAIPAGEDVVANVPGVQATIKNRWPDGSAKFVVAAGAVNLIANTQRTVSFGSGVAPAGTALSESDLIVTGIQASVSFGSYGVVELAPLVGTTAAYSAGAGHFGGGRVATWVTGPEMSSWVYSAPIGTDAHLVAWFEVRLWKDGRIEILPWIENGYLMVAGPGAKSGTAVFKINDDVRFSKSLTLANHQRVVLASGTTLSHWQPDTPQVVVAHDTHYLQSTRLVPTYHATTSPTNPLLNTFAASYVPLSLADYPENMGTAGYHRSIGLLPQWDVVYLTSGAHLKAWRGVIINGYAAGQYGTHFRDERTHQPLRFSGYPHIVLNGQNAGVSSIGASTTDLYTPTASGTAPRGYAMSHHPSMGYMAYLITGRWYFKEEVQFVSTLNFLKIGDERRQQTTGIIDTPWGEGTTRGAAWALRSLVQAATATPDDDPLRPEFMNAIAANIDYHHQRYVAPAGRNPQGVAEPYEDYTAGDGIYMHSIWMEDFFTAAWGYARDLDLDLLPAPNDRFSELLAWKAQSIIGRLGGGSINEYCYRDAAQYTIAIGPADSLSWGAGSAGPWYSTWGEIYAATVGHANDCNADSTLRGAYFPEGTSYWGNLQPAIAYAVTNRVPGAAAAYAHMSGASNWSQILDAWDQAPEWGVRPR